MPRPVSTTFRPPNARTVPSDLWTPGMIRQAEIAADAGNLRLAAELCDAIMGDDRVQGARLHLAGLFGLPLSFDDGVGRLRRRARRALEAEEDWWAAFSDESLVELLMWGVLLGVALAQIEWTEQRGRVVPRLKVWHPRALRWDPHTAGWKVRLHDGTEIAITPGDGTWVVFSPHAENEPWKHGAWRAIARWWRAKHYGRDDWGRHSEQAAGLKVATTEDGTDEDRQKIGRDLSTAGADAAVAMPPKWDLKQLSVAAATVAVFDGLIDKSNDAITISFLGQNLTTEVREGSRAAATVHEAVSITVLRRIASSLAAVLRAQVLVPWAVFNFGDADVAPWPVWDVEPPPDKSQDAEITERRVRAAAVMHDKGAPIDWAELAKAHGVPLRVVRPAPEGGAALSARSEPDPGATTSAERRAIGGQLYVDAVYDAAMARSGAALDAGMVGAVLAAIRDARDPADLRARLDAIRGEDSQAFRELVYGALVCAAGAGLFSAAPDEA